MPRTSALGKLRQSKSLRLACGTVRHCLKKWGGREEGRRETEEQTQEEKRKLVYSES